MADMIKVAEKTFTASLYFEGSWGERDAGEHESTMTLYADGRRAFIEWDIPGLDETEHIGLIFEYESEQPGAKLVLTDYDGVFSLPEQAIDLLRANGYIVPQEFE